MTEWGVIGVIITLFVFIVGVVTPILRLNTNITKLTEAVKVLQENLKEITTKSEASDRELLNQYHAHDITLENHEMRIKAFEKLPFKGAEK